MINITHNERNVNYQSNTRLLDRGAFELCASTRSYYYWVPDGDGYAPVEESYRWNDPKNPLANEVRVRGPRKQRAARYYIPRETIKIVPVEPLVMEELVSDKKDRQQVEAAKMVIDQAKLMEMYGNKIGYRAEREVEDAKVRVMRSELMTMRPVLGEVDEATKIKKRMADLLKLLTGGVK